MRRGRECASGTSEQHALSGLHSRFRPPSQAVRGALRQRGSRRRPPDHIAGDTEQLGARRVLRSMRRYSSAPRKRMMGTLKSVSTLLMTVGLPNRPKVVGKAASRAGNRASLRWIQRAPSPHRRYRRQRPSGSRYQMRSLIPHVRTQQSSLARASTSAASRTGSM